MIGIVLAAGSGGRMGGPKARLLFDREPLASLHARRLLDAGARHVVVVLSPEDRDLDLFGAVAAFSTAPDQAGSLAVGLGAVPGVAADEVLLVTPVDALPASARTLALLATSVTAATVAAVPTYGERGGHPIAARRSVLDAGRGRPLRDVLHALGDRCARIAVDDPHVTTDLDTPADAIRILGGPPRFHSR